MVAEVTERRDRTKHRRVREEGDYRWKLDGRAARLDTCAPQKKSERREGLNHPTGTRVSGTKSHTRLLLLGARREGGESFEMLMATAMLIFFSRGTRSEKEKTCAW